MTLNMRPAWPWEERWEKNSSRWQLVQPPTTLIYAMRRYEKSRGIAALCLGGGNAVALAVERI